MNKGTKIRTVVLVIAVINQAISQVGDPDFGNETANVVYRVVSYIFTVAAAATAFWYNNDFTEEACIGTNLTRQLKIQRQAMEYENEFLSEAMNAEAEEDPETEEGE